MLRYRLSLLVILLGSQVLAQDNAEFFKSVSELRKKTEPKNLTKLLLNITNRILTKHELKNSEHFELISKRIPSKSAFREVLYLQLAFSFKLCSKKAKYIEYQELLKKSYPNSSLLKAFDKKYFGKRCPTCKKNNTPETIGKIEAKCMKCLGTGKCARRCKNGKIQGHSKMLKCTTCNGLGKCKKTWPSMYVQEGRTSSICGL